MVQQELDRLRQDALYLDQHRDELLQRYPDRWVAVYHREVVGTARNLQRLVLQLKRKGIPPTEVYCQRLSTKEDLPRTPESRDSCTIGSFSVQCYRVRDVEHPAVRIRGDRRTSAALEAALSFGPFPISPTATGDIRSLKVPARLRTNPDGSSGTGAALPPRVGAAHVLRHS